MNILIGTDHRGFLYKESLIKETKIGSHDLSWIDKGTYSPERTDYPLFAAKVVSDMKKGVADRAVLICGSGIGMALVANRVNGIYAGVAWNANVARIAREDDNINVLVIPADYVSFQDTRSIIEAWLDARFKEGRYAQRISMIDALR